MTTCCTVMIGCLIAATAAAAQPVAEQPLFSARTQLMQLTVRPAQPPPWLGRGWQASDFVVVDQEQTREVAFLDSILVPLDLVVISNIRGAIAPRVVQDLQQQFDEGMGLLMGDDRVGGVSPESCSDGVLALVRRDQQVGSFSASRRPGPAERISDPIGCAVRMLIQAATRRAKSILILSGGTAEPLGWRRHLKEILLHGITVYVCTIPTQPAPGFTWSLASPRRFPGRPIPTAPPGANQTNGVSVQPADDGLDPLLDVSGGTRIQLAAGERRLPGLFKVMKDAMLLGYYPPDQPGDCPVVR